jgi:predicted RNA-binding Zn ribbon-like protein
MAAEGRRLMLELTWEWISIYEPALDLANTVAIEKSVERDLLAPAGEYARWAAAAARSPQLGADEAAAIRHSEALLLELREHIRAIFKATAAGEQLPKGAVAALNRASRAAPGWTEITTDGSLDRQASGPRVHRLLAAYARSAMAVAAEGRTTLRVCGAPSCGMFYRPRRRQQRWCSDPCGNRARFARHYARRTST